MKAIISRLKSKTYALQFFVLALGVLELNFHLLQSYLGNWYGISFIIISVFGAFVRELTKAPVGDK
jgi:hypothetical protein